VAYFLNTTRPSLVRVTPSGQFTYYDLELIQKDKTAWDQNFANWEREFDLQMKRDKCYP
jgi:hypothetical protein